MHAKQFSYHTVKSINKRYSRKCDARIQAYRDQMSGQISSGF